MSEREQKPASWVIREKGTGKVIAETFDKRKVELLNTAKYEAVPIMEHLQSLNRNIRAVEALEKAWKEPAGPKHFRVIGEFDLYRGDYLMRHHFPLTVRRDGSDLFRVVAERCDQEVRNHDYSRVEFVRLQPEWRR